jgi:hypothetical protein
VSVARKMIHKEEESYGIARRGTEVVANGVEIETGSDMLLGDNCLL